MNERVSGISEDGCLMTYSDFRKPTWLASYEIGAVIEHTMEDIGHRPIAMVPRMKTKWKDVMHNETRRHYS